MIKRIIVSVDVFAQYPEMHERHERMREKLELHNVASYSDKIVLPADKAKEFCPVYEQFEEKDMQWPRSMRMAKDVIDLSEVEAEKIVREPIEKEMAELLRMNFSKYFHLKGDTTW